MIFRRQMANDLARPKVLMAVLGIGLLVAGSAIWFQITQAGDNWLASPVARDWYGKGRLSARQGKALAEQEQCYRQAIADSPRFVAAYDALAEVLVNGQKWSAAESVAREALHVNPADASAHKWLGIALWPQNKSTEAEAELRQAARLNPDDAETYARLGYICFMSPDQAEAEAALSRAVRLETRGPLAAATHAELGYLLAEKKRRGPALAQLAAAAKLAASGDFWIEAVLGQAYIRLQAPALAVEHAEKYLALARPMGMNPEECKQFEAYVQFAKPRLTPTYFTNAPPVGYTPSQLQEALRQKLLSAELALVVNPLEYTPEMRRWAEQHIAGATNELDRACVLFAELSARAEGTGLLPSAQLTAPEIFAFRDRPDFKMYCTQGTYLYVALARAVGLQANVAAVTEACDGTKTGHCCAAIFISGRMLLVDPSYHWFGVPHRQFAVLNDIQTIGHHLSGYDDVARRELAVRLAPEDALAQFNLGAQLIRLERWDEAREVLQQLRKIDHNGDQADSLEAMLDIHAGRYDQAATVMQEAIAIDPHNFLLRLQLADTYALQNKTPEALQAMQAALACPHTAADAELIAKFRAQLTSSAP